MVGERMTFANLRQGMRARIVATTGQTANSTRLQEMGLTVGTIFKVVKVAPFGDPVEIDLRGYRLCLRKQETGDFEVEPVD
ncbi:MAG TPA: FeoA domain-containing protein [Fimbriimonas sp.]|nr:FeoA domain-containing protein [Fimbriimonas sp.]